MDAAELAELKRDALSALRGVLRAPDAKPADALRAAEIVARLNATGTTRGALHELDDLELLALARGEGGTPRKGDPETPSAGSVPSGADGHPSARLATREVVGGLATREVPAAEAPVAPRETSPKGTQNGPASREDPPAEINPLLAIRKKGPDGTQNGPVISGGPSAQFAPPPQIGHSLEPWE